MRKIFSTVYGVGALAVVLFIGCTANQVQDTISTASAVLSAASGILMPVDPPLGAVLAKASSDFTDVGKAYADYLKADATLKGQKASELRAALATIQGNLGQLLNDLHVRHPELVEYITVGVAVANTAIDLVLTHVEDGRFIASRDVSGKPVVAGARSASDLKVYWNNKVRGAYPMAVVK